MSVASLPRARRPARGSDRVERARRSLARHFGPSRLLVDERDTEAYRKDASELVGAAPIAVVLASEGRDVERALAVAAEAQVPLVPRGGGTGKVGGAVPVEPSIVLSTLGLNRIKEIDTREGLARVEPGVLLADFSRQVEACGLFYPPDPSSRVQCAIGGNVATNAGGPRAFKYGVTGRYVLGMEAFLLGGQRIQVGRATAKGVTGYDVASLLVGSEGTLAVIGEVTLRLIQPPAATLTLLAPFASMQGAASAVMRLVERGVGARCLELLDLRLLPDVVARELGAAHASEAVLLVEVDGSEAACQRLAEQVAALCEEHGASGTLVAQDASHRARMWALRENMSATLRQRARHKLSEDVAVPRRRLGELLSSLAAISARRSVRSVAYGHAGDGNLHVNFLWDDPREVAQVQAAVSDLFQRVVALGGTLSGEHGIGLLKAAYLPVEQASGLILLERQLKQAFDPRALLNPGKIFVRTAPAGG